MDDISLLPAHPLTTALLLSLTAAAQSAQRCWNIRLAAASSVSLQCAIPANWQS